MNPSKLCDTAIAYELKIRNIQLVNRETAERDLRAAYRQEKEDPESRPKPVVEDPAAELAELDEYLGELGEMCAATPAMTRDRTMREAIYVRLCYVERRFTYFDIQEFGDVQLHTYRELRRVIKGFRQRNFPDKHPHIVYAVHGLAGADDTIMEPPGEGENVFTPEDEQKLMEARKSLEEARKSLEEIQKKKFLATRAQADYPDVEEEEEVEDEVINLDRRDPLTSTPAQTQPPQERRPHRGTEMFRNGPRVDDIFQPRSSAFNSNAYKGLPIHKWTIKFRGETDGSVVNFLRDVKIRADAEEIRDETLHKKIHSLFEGEASQWYTIYGSKCVDWNAMVAKLKEDFIPKDFDYKTEQEIRQAAQKERESFQSFLIRLELLFSQLSYAMTEEKKVEHLVHLMLHKYKSIETSKCKTVEELKELCKYRDSIDTEV